ncbi:hypothetical protein AKJ58_01265 [candidate division MSBL1 archaeon SCGC-AAA385D11]|uniref:Uncharacterized protein n=1 Tax=candidate division MSBL1 archaeon SCGC-AAA385D11 TaxID=1698286 RepID=A0A133VNK0_9EURY|nr:hypothetical protein AKJ58_01265 [candidate division MSBL1 archaeon SCGC-AAA385D11]
MSFEDLESDEESAIHDLAWRLVFRELSNEEMVQLAYEIVLCSMMDRNCRNRALKALKDVVG